MPVEVHLRKRTWNNPLLRSIKIGVIATTVVGTAFISSFVLARPAHAELFVPQKLGCHSFVELLWGTCRGSAPTYSNSSNDALKKGDTSSKSNSPSDITGQPMPLLDITVAPQTVSIPQLPAPLTEPQVASSNATPLYASVAYGGEKVSGQVSAPRAFVRPTTDGWYLLGVAWYWWVMGAALLCMGVMWYRRFLVRRRPVLVK